MESSQTVDDAVADLAVSEEKAKTRPKRPIKYRIMNSFKKR
jgi:hypothetical protein